LEPGIIGPDPAGIIGGFIRSIIYCENETSNPEESIIYLAFIAI